MKDILDTYGVTPIPPYFNRDTDDSDSERYQTVFAKTYGSVAAPTASLHFSKDLLQKMEKKHLLTKCVLHVGAGTFKPVHEDGILLFNFLCPLVVVKPEPSKLLYNNDFQNQKEWSLLIFHLSSFP